jgi:hypothetical protein
MAIFSNRSVARMLSRISPALGSMRENELIARLRSNPDAAVAVEWEIAVIYCLSKQGRIEGVPARHGVREPEIVYTATDGSRVAIEVTAVSDASFEEKNPIRAFADELLRITLKQGIHHLGGIRYDIGHVKGERGPILGVPPRQEIQRFFASNEFRTFISGIKSTPSQARQLKFDFHGAASTLKFQPGKATGGGGHIVHNLPFDVSNNPIVSRLKSKDRQISKTELELPCVVVLCDGDCAAFNETMSGSSALTAKQVADVFLNGYPNDQTTLWLNSSAIRPKSRRINGVVLWAVRENYSPWTGERPQRNPVAQLVNNRCATHYPMAAQIVAEVADSIRFLPRIARTPLNARRHYPLPEYYGGFSISGRSPVKIQMSLLTLQYVLSGRIPFDKFVKDNEELVGALKRLTDDGFAISAIEVKKCPDHDDDWIEFHFDDTAPTHLFVDDGVRRKRE